MFELEINQHYFYVDMKKKSMLTNFKLSNSLAILRMIRNFNFFVSEILFLQDSDNFVKKTY